MHFQSTELFLYWVKQELHYFSQRGQINYSQNREYEWNQQWSQLIDNGFVYRLFEQIDDQYFSTTLTEKHQAQQIKRQTLLKQYWLQLDKYLNLTQSKQITPSYLSQQTIQKKQLTSREYSRTSNSSMETSIIELIKMLFYLLVQKYNNNNGDIQQNEQSQGKNVQDIDQTLAFSQVSKEEGESVRGSFTDQQNTGLSVQKQSQVTLTDVGNSGDIGSLSIEHERENNNSCQNQQEEQGASSLFLERICELSQQVQQYLVTVVQSIEQKHLIQPIDFTQQSPLAQSFLYIQQPLTASNNSQQNLKKILYRQIQQVSQQNQQLKQKMQQIIEQNLKLQKQLQDNQQQQTQLVNKINTYNYEKQQLFQYLKQQHGVSINSLEEFIQIVQHIQHQNQLLENTIAEIEQRNYNIQMQNALKIHTINKNALEITQVNEDINKVKSKIVDLKQDIEYLDEFVNGATGINAQMICSINVGEFDNHEGEESMMYEYDDQQIVNGNNDSSFFFNKSIDLQARHSFGHVLRENHDIYNEKVTCKTNTKPTHNRVLTDSLTGYGPNRSSLHTSQKPSTHKKHHKSSFPPKDQQNIDPTPFQQDELILQHFPHCHSKSHSHVSVNYQLKEQERAIEEEKEKYKQDLVNSLELLYKEISDLTKEVTQAKEENKVLEKKNKGNERKISQLRALHQSFLQEARRA